MSWLLSTINHGSCFSFPSAQAYTRVSSLAAEQGPGGRGGGQYRTCSACQPGHSAHGPAGEGPDHREEQGAPLESLLLSQALLQAPHHFLRLVGILFHCVCSAVCCFLSSDTLVFVVMITVVLQRVLERGREIERVS